MWKNPTDLAWAWMWIADADAVSHREAMSWPDFVAWIYSHFSCSWLIIIQFIVSYKCSFGFRPGTKHDQATS